MTELKDYLQNLTGNELSQALLAEAIDTSPQSLSARMKNPKSEVTVSELEAAKKYLNLIEDVKTDLIVDGIEADYYPEVFGSCGSGSFVLSEVKEKVIVPRYCFNSYSRGKKYSVINARGDSMQPYIQNKDLLIVEHREGEQIYDNCVYVFCYDDQIFVKRLIRNVDEIIVKSDNPDPMYRPRYIEKDDMNNLIIIGQIVGLMRDMKQG